MTLFINNLPPQIVEADLLELFEDYGTIKHIFLPRDWKTNLCLGFAFIEMTIKKNEKLAMSNFNGYYWMGYQLQISEVSSQECTKTSVVGKADTYEF